MAMENAKMSTINAQNDKLIQLLVESTENNKIM